MKHIIICLLLITSSTSFSQEKLNCMIPKKYHDIDVLYVINESKQDTAFTIHKTKDRHSKRIKLNNQEYILHKNKILMLLEDTINKYKNKNMVAAKKSLDIKRTKNMWMFYSGSELCGKISFKATKEHYKIELLSYDTKLNPEDFATLLNIFNRKELQFDYGDDDEIINSVIIGVIAGIIVNQ